MSKNNYKVIQKVSGEATASYILGIGGFSDKALVEKAKSQMLENANLIGGSKAIINTTVELHYNALYIFYFEKTVTVNGYLIEFTE